MKTEGYIELGTVVDSAAPNNSIFRDVADNLLKKKDNAGAVTTISTNTTQVTGITLTSGSWSLVTGLYEYDYANVNITVNSIVDVIPANADIAIVQAAEVLPQTDSSAGSVKLYATNAPTGDIGVTINITEKA